MLIPFVCMCVSVQVFVCVCGECRLLHPVGEDYVQCHGRLGDILNEACIMHHLCVPHVPSTHCKHR